MFPIRVSCVSYLNSLPFVYGLQNHKVSDSIILSLDSPVECAFKLREGIVDVGLIPVAAINSVPNAKSFSKWCIGADGPVKSVTLLSEVPMNEIRNIILDFQSVTSNLLTRLLAKNFWNISPVFLPAHAGIENEIRNNTAAIVIGDRSLAIQDQFEYCYDLSAEWKKFTGLPFVFARWISNKILENDFLNEFENALDYGVQSIDEIIAALKNKPDYLESTADYLKKNLSYTFDQRKKEGMELFLDYAARIDSIGVKELR